MCGCVDVWMCGCVWVCMCVGGGEEGTADEVWKIGLRTNVYYTKQTVTAPSACERNMRRTGPGVPRRKSLRGARSSHSRGESGDTVDPSVSPAHLHQAFGHGRELRWQNRREGVGKRSGF